MVYIICLDENDLSISLDDGLLGETLSPPKLNLTSTGLINARLSSLENPPQPTEIPSAERVDACEFFSTTDSLSEPISSYTPIEHSAPIDNMDQPPNSPTGMALDLASKVLEGTIAADVVQGVKTIYANGDKLIHGEGGERSEAALELSKNVALIVATGKGGNLVGKFFKPQVARVLLSEPESIAKTVRYTELALNASKANVRALLRSGELNLPAPQVDKLLQTFGNGRMDSITLKLMNTGEVKLSAIRAGRASGFQRMSFEIDQTGNTNKVVQTAFDDAKNLVPQRSDEPKNNLYDVKKWTK